MFKIVLFQNNYIRPTFNIHLDHRNELQGGPQLKIGIRTLAGNIYLRDGIKVFIFQDWFNRKLIQSWLINLSHQVAWWKCSVAQSPTERQSSCELPTICTLERFALQLSLSLQEQVLGRHKMKVFKETKYDFLVPLFLFCLAVFQVVYKIICNQKKWSLHQYSVQKNHLMQGMTRIIKSIENNG